MLKNFMVMAPEGEPTAGGGSYMGTPPATPPAAGGQAGGTPPPTNSYKEGDWRYSLPDDIREDANFKNLNDVTALAKSFVHAQKMIGADKVPLPGKHATEEDWQKFYDTLGRPPVDKYEVKLPKDSKFLNPEWMAELKPIAHKLGVMPAQLEKIAEWYESKNAGFAKSQSEAAEKSVKEQITAMEAEWGMAKEQKQAYCRTVFQKLVDPEAQEWLNKTGVGNSPHLIKTFAKIGEMLFKEDTIVQGQPGGKMLFTPGEATKKANDILMDGNHPYNRPEHPNHAAAVQEVKELFEMAYPKAQA